VAFIQVLEAGLSSIFFIGASQDPSRIGGRTLSYLIKGPALRILATYAHNALPGDITANSIQLGAQAIFF
jgi:hypothetical protein